MSLAELLIPVQRFRSGSGSFRLPDEAALASPTTADLVPFEQLALDLADLGVTAVLFRDAFGPATVRIRRGVAPKGAPAGCADAYRMAIAPQGIEVIAAGDAGAYYAIQTLREMLTIYGRKLPLGVIEDWPDYARRGVYHDCSRGKVPKLSTLKGLVAQLARWKINELQLYVENVFTFQQHPAIGRGYSPFTPEELLDLQDFCTLHHVRLVGSLSSFGHMEKILALPEYRHLDEMAGFEGAPGSTLCPTDPKSIAFVASLYEEFVPLFEAEDFNVCCDETWELGRGRSRTQADKVGIGALYGDFLRKIHALCETHGKRMNAWADIVLDHPETLAALPQDIVMLNWDYDPAGVRIPRTKEIADAGLPLAVCPGTNAWNSHGCRLRMGMENIAVFAREGIKHGAELLLNTDWGDGGHRNMLAVSLHNLAYGAAHSWCGKCTKDAGFTERFCARVFGRDLRALPAAITTLGSANENTGQRYDNWLASYPALLGSVSHSVGPGGWLAAGSMKDVRREGLANHRAALRAIRWPTADQAPSPFLAQMLEEFALATRLDLAGTLRLAVLMDLRAGKSPRQAEVKTLISETEQLTAELKRVWLLGNRPSRLADITRRLRQSLTEYRRMLE